VSEYIVTCDKLELPRGTSFTVIPGPVESGALVMFQMGRRRAIGRWLNVNGFDFILLPDYLLACEIPLRIYGRVVVGQLCLN
jgi:hypothetical protein